MGRIMSFITIKNSKNELIYLNIEGIDSVEVSDGKVSIFTRNGRKIECMESMAVVGKAVDKALSKPKTVRTHTEWAG
jgi:DNA-binding LytR/AlgR family response regulator